MNNDVVNFSHSQDDRMHELAMLYLNKTVPENITKDTLAKMYVDTYFDISNAVNKYKRITQPTMK